MIALPPRTAKGLYEYLRQALPENADLEARIILKTRAGLEWSSLIAQLDLPINEEVTNIIEADLNARLSGTPLSRIYGRREFWGLEFEINEYTLDPRPDTETLIERALERLSERPPETILDLGTGSGCILLALLSEFKNAKGIGVDISKGAIEAAQNNAKNLGLEARATFQTGNWTDGIDQKFDLVVSNPPYIESKVIQNLKKEVRNHDPIQALDGGKDGMDDYNKIFSTLKHALKPSGIALFEIGFDQSDKITRLSEKYAIHLGDIIPDIAGNPRVVDISLQKSCGDK